MKRILLMSWAGGILGTGLAFPLFWNMVWLLRGDEFAGQVCKSPRLWIFSGVCILIGITVFKLVKKIDVSKPKEST